ncbi:MAG: molybdopterin-dependent oxidoreductase [Candidatus Magnetoovum sp. WYHC-5]|nr:molybdopterin-dependent oxidoreductase [Candidatus Magnetoovum sp. WYHC-5]
MVYVEDGRVIKVRGDADSPISRGWMCVKGINSSNIANHPQRLTVPLKRTGGRGSGSFKKLSWEAAFTEITEKLSALRQCYGTESIVLGQGTGRHHYMHVVRFANALGTPNWYEPGLAQCFIPRITVSNMTYGGFVHADYYNKQAPQCIIFWGHNPLVSSADGELAICVQRAINTGAKTIAVDPRRSDTARKCHMWLPIRPATDAALALAMIHVIIEDKLYDKDFVEQWTTGFDELSAHIKQYTAKWAAQITGITEGDIKDAARIYATNKPAVIDWGVGIEQNVNSLQTVRAIAILRAITGNLDVPGGDILGMHILKAYPTLKEKLPQGISKKRLGVDEFKLLSGFRAYMPSAHIPAIFRAMQTCEPYKISALMLFGNNPLLTVANSKKVWQAIRELELFVVSDLFMTPSAYYADYVLPAAFWTEIEHLMGFPLVAENMVFAQPKITQFHDAKQDEFIIDELSRRLQLPGSHMSYREIFDYQLSPLSMTFDELLKIGYYYPEHKYKKYIPDGFRTPSKKVELYSSFLKRLNYAPLPDYIEPPETPVSNPELAKEFPYILITGGRKREFFHSEHRQVEGLRRLSPYPVVELHVKLAKKLGIDDGQWVAVSCRRGEIKMKAKLTENIRHDVVHVEHGWWFPERLNDANSFFESNANVLTCDDAPYDPAFGSYQLRGLLCNIKKF